MAEDSGDATLIKIAVFGIAMSIMCTAFISVLFTNNNDYDYDEINEGRQELVNFSGETMLNQSPWKLTHVYTPWNNSYSSSQTDADGWLYGTEITDYDYIGKTADIKLATDQKSSVPLSYDEDVTTYTVTTQTGYKWWAAGGIEGLNPVGIAAKYLLNMDVENYETNTIHTNQWNFTGYRYVFDPMLPFSSTDTETSEVSTVDGSLNLVWYDFNGTEGLSGGLEIYGGNILLASYTAADIATDYNTSSDYATTYDFDFEGTHLTLSIKFDQSVIESGVSLMQAWTQGSWSMAVSSTSAGNFFDIDGSTSFTATAGSMIDTFIQIYTFSLPSVDNSWMDLILWLLVGLPMTMAMLLITLRLINGFRVL